MMSLIELRNVSKSFKGLSLFENLSVSFEKGKIYGIVGHNGSGKSVLFKMMCGFVFPDQGSVIVNGEELGKNKRFPENFGIIIDKPGYLGDKTGFENLRYLADIQNKISDEKIKEILEKVGLSHTIMQKVKNYSLGMKQKLAIAQAIMEDQEILLLDEPFNGLDVDSVENIRDLLKSLNNQGKTIFLTSHNNEDIDILCDHVFRVRNYSLEQLK
ncbi:ABC transporter ATP-binding protein [Turicibacter bilis]|uniref:ABC transporter ATP-binding protein NatA n=3 Tax=Bacillota TaxID=1239 RepID=A0A140L4A7_9FIRM|nr:ABC transporter ATP-binding protein NatA [Thermotalea metallivorans]KXZ39198.1 Heme-transporting ATPase [[Clostridium] paradoxum JW-YL-7 = DSM 7308]UUF11240.1 ABC transporter ATP-binding protein [Turicibacter bilis]SHL32785.1 ABC-2 type transport system ATP-binding protein [[Clostridium] paradoxum JW-YL-7 = DSM 7308]